MSTRSSPGPDSFAMLAPGFLPVGLLALPGATKSFILLLNFRWGTTSQTFCCRMSIHSSSACLLSELTDAFLTMILHDEYRSGLAARCTGQPAFVRAAKLPHPSLVCCFPTPSPLPHQHTHVWGGTASPYLEGKFMRHMGWST